jgi:hypothetical protein
MATKTYKQLTLTSYVGSKRKAPEPESEPEPEPAAAPDVPAPAAAADAAAAPRKPRKPPPPRVAAAVWFGRLIDVERDTVDYHTLKQFVRRWVHSCGEAREFLQRSMYIQPQTSCVMQHLDRSHEELYNPIVVWLSMSAAHRRVAVPQVDAERFARALFASPSLRQSLSEPHHLLSGRTALEWALDHLDYRSPARFGEVMIATMTLPDIAVHINWQRVAVLLWGDHAASSAQYGTLLSGYVYDDKSIWKQCATVHPRVTDVILSQCPGPIVGTMALSYAFRMHDAALRDAILRRAGLDGYGLGMDIRMTVLDDRPVTWQALADHRIQQIRGPYRDSNSSYAHEVVHLRVNDVVTWTAELARQLYDAEVYRKALTSLLLSKDTEHPLLSISVLARLVSEYLHQ